MGGGVTSALADLQARMGAGEAFTRADVDRIFACRDLISVGLVGEAARRRLRGQQVTFGRVAIDAGEAPPVDLGDAGELRLTHAGEDTDAAIARVAAARARANGLPVTGFSLPELLALAGGDHLTLAEIARALLAAGLESAAEAPLDALGDTEHAIEVVRAVRHGGLGVWRATVTRAGADERAALIERAADIQEATGAFRAFAPLPALDPREAPATGYDDVHTIAAARVRCRAIRSIQVDWSLYGPKLAQVAIAYGADDIDAVSPVDVLQLGHRRSPREDLERQIRAAFAEPVLRNGRFEPLP